MGDWDNPVKRRLEDEFRILGTVRPGIFIDPGPVIYRTALIRPFRRLRSDAALLRKLGGEVLVLPRKRGTNPIPGKPKRYAPESLKPSVAYRTVIFGKKVSPPDRFQAASATYIPNGTAYSGATVLADSRYAFEAGRAYDIRGWNAMVAAKLSPSSDCEKPKILRTGKGDSDFVRFLAHLQDYGVNGPPEFWVKCVKRAAKLYNGPVLGYESDSEPSGDEWEECDEDEP